MKRTLILLILTAGLSATNSMAQAEGDEARTSERPAARRDGERRIERGDRNTEPARRPQEDAAPARRTERPADREAAAPDDRPPRLGRGAGQFQPPLRGQGLGPLAGRPQRLQGEVNFCPCCGRPLGPGAAAQGFGQGFGRGGQGPGWAPPPWVGRGTLQRNSGPGPLARRFGRPDLGGIPQHRMLQDGVRPPWNRDAGAGRGPMRREFGGAGRADDQVERSRPEPRDDDRRPARRPAPEGDDR